jgi:ABC-type multidrug transport system permease subunit
MSARSAFAARLRVELARRWRDKIALAMWVGIPLAIGGLISLAVGRRSGPAPRAHVLVVDLDDSFLSRAVVQALSSPRAQVFECEVVEETAGRERIRAGDASALVVIPGGFGDALLSETPTTLELVTNPSQRILPGIVREAASMLSEAVFYAHRVLGGPLKEIARDIGRGGGPSDAARVATEVQRAIERVAPFAFPPVIAPEFVEPPREHEGQPPSLAQLYLPSVLVMALFFVAQGISEDLWRERVLGALRRATTGPVRPWTLLAGKLAAAWVIALALSVLALCIGSLALGVPAQRIPLAALWASGVGVALTALMVLLQMLASSQRAAGILGNALLFPLLMLGGGFFPFEAMPPAFAAAGRWTPNGRGLTVLSEILQGEITAARAAASFAGLALAGAVLFAACNARFARAFARR